MPDTTDIGELYLEGYSEYPTIIKAGDILTFSFDSTKRAVTGITNGLFSGNRRNKLTFTPPVPLLKDGTVTIWPAGTTNFTIDYRLKAGGGLVDSGENALPSLPVAAWPSYVFGRDLLGIVRPQGAGWDIGVYESSTGGGGIEPSPPTGLRVN